jgi:hypothetical protein
MLCFDAPSWQSKELACVFTVQFCLGCAYGIIQQTAAWYILFIPILGYFAKVQDLGFLLKFSPKIL